MRKKTKEFLTTTSIISAVVIATGTVMAFLLSGIPVLQIIATVIIIAALIYGTWFWCRDCEDDDFRG